MNAIWLSDLERQIRNAKHGVVVRTHRTCVSNEAKCQIPNRRILSRGHIRPVVKVRLDRST